MRTRGLCLVLFATIGVRIHGVSWVVLACDDGRGSIATAPAEDFKFPPKRRPAEDTGRERRIDAESIPVSSERVEVGIIECDAVLSALRDCTKSEGDAGLDAVDVLNKTHRHWASEVARAAGSDRMRALSALQESCKAHWESVKKLPCAAIVRSKIAP